MTLPQASPLWVRFLNGQLDDTDRRKYDADNDEHNPEHLHGSTAFGLRRSRQTGDAERACE
jgi:hypothetical protein